MAVEIEAVEKSLEFAPKRRFRREIELIASHPKLFLTFSWLLFEHSNWRGCDDLLPHKIRHSAITPKRILQQTVKRSEAVQPRNGGSNVGRFVKLFMAKQSRMGGLLRVQIILFGFTWLL
jgi:hypothetical protein